MTGKGERERYTQLKVEFQRITWRDKKVFLDEQCQELKENNRMGKTRDLFKKIRVIKGIFQAKVCTVKDRSGKDLIEAEEIKKRWKEYTKELYRKYLAAAVKSLQSCPTLCDPIDGSPPGSPVPGILQARTLEWVAISFSNA